MSLQIADTGLRPDQIVWRQRAQEWVGRNGAYLGLIALFAGLGAIAATEYWRSLSMTVKYDQEGIWDWQGPWATAAVASVFGGVSFLGAVTMTIIAAREKAKSTASEDESEAQRRDTRALQALQAAAYILAAFAITYAAFVFASDHDHVVKIDQIERHYSTLNQGAITAGRAIGIPLTIAGGVCLLVTGALYVKSQYKRSES